MRARRRIDERLSGPLVSVVAVLAAFALGAVMIMALGANPWEGFTALFDGAFGGRRELADTATKATPLLLVGAGICISFRAKAINDVSFSVRGGEVLGIAGVSGNGQRELAEAIAGLRATQTGRVAVNGVDVSGGSPRAVRAAGLAYVPEERMRDGAIADFAVWENLLLLDHGRPPFCSRGMLQTGAVRSHAKQLVADFAGAHADARHAHAALSCGNIQKLIMAWEMTATMSKGAAGVLVVSQPTRGVDIGAAEYIHACLMAARDAGLAVLVISEDLDEVLALSDRVGVMFEGRLVSILDRDECSLERLGLMMAGAGDRRDGSPGSVSRHTTSCCRMT